MLEAARKKYEAEVKAIELVWKLHRDTKQKTPRGKKQNLAQNLVPVAVHGSQLEQIKQTSRRLPQPFTLSHIKNALPHIRGGYMSTALFRLAEEHFLNCVDESRPKKYVVKEKASAHA